jgi:hypothetical protein
MPKRPIPYEFVTDYLTSLPIIIKPMFGCYIIYLGNKMILFLRQRKKEPWYNGVYLATHEQYHDKLLKEFGLVSRKDFFQNEKKRKWLFIAEEDAHFESAVNTACQLIKKGDKRVGRDQANKS